MTPRKLTILEVSPQCYAEIAAALRSHEARHCIADTGAEVIDMSGIAIQSEPHTHDWDGPCFGPDGSYVRCVRCDALSGNWVMQNGIIHVPQSANAIKEQAHVERPEERQQQKETEHVV